MKFIVSLSRFFFVFVIWTCGYLFWIQRLMLAFWRFNPMSSLHWQYLLREWKGGWVIRSPKEWAFVIVLFTAIPVWLTGWAILSAVPWSKWLKLIFLFPIRLIRSKIKEKHAAKPKVTKRKSYKQTRPPAVRAGSGRIKSPEKAPEEEKEEHKHSHAAAQQTAEQPRSHSESKASPAAAPAHSSAAPAKSGGSIMDILRSAGYRLISDAKIAGKKIDFAAVAANHILLCLIDSESGDWLADEERFNDEEPLWFSESNHRISPVRIVLNARDALAPMLTGDARGMEIKPMVVIRQGTIINAEDMFEVWNGLNVTVCRYEDGGPDEITALPAAVSQVKSPDDGLFHSVSGILG
mgnify:CR=1 FL=1